VAQSIRFAGPNGELQGAWAAAARPKGVVLVIHENRGLTDHIRSIPPRFAADGYSALAVDLLSEEGGTAAVGGDAQAIAALGAAPATRLVADLRAGIDELGRRVPNQKVGVIGFCFGGGMTWQLLAAGEPRVAAAAPFYGPAPAAPSFTGSKAAVLAVYAENDARVNATRDAAVGALQSAGLTVDVRTYPGTGHAFFNDTGASYNAAAATEAYRAVLDWFGRYLGT
jgi:carboxymethylenebutenolidase